jgi:hypothetical protein
MTPKYACPFCRSHDTYARAMFPEVHFPSRFWVVCNGCNARGSEGRTARQAAERWDGGIEVANAPIDPDP